MPTRLDVMRMNCRLVTRVVGEEIFAATLDLGSRLPPELSRARMVCVPVLISVTRDLIDREMRGLPVTRGPSINAIAASLDIPFETVRRNVQKMAELGWIEIGAAGGVSLPVPMGAELAIWCVELGHRLRRAAKVIEVGMRDGEVVEMTQPTSAKRRAQDAVAEIERARKPAGVDHHRLAVRPGDQERVALPHVERRDPQRPAVTRRE